MSAQEIPSTARLGLQARQSRVDTLASTAAQAECDQPQSSILEPGPLTINYCIPVTIISECPMRGNAVLLSPVTPV